MAILARFILLPEDALLMLTLSMRQAGALSRQTHNKFTKCLKNVKIVDFHNCIWNRHRKCIQISTNMPRIKYGIILFHECIKMFKCPLLFSSDEVKQRLHLQRISGCKLSPGNSPPHVAAYVPGVKVNYHL